LGVGTTSDKENPQGSNIAQKNYRVKGESGWLMVPRGQALTHPVGLTLLEYENNGCPVDVDRPWTREEILVVAEWGPHKLALA